MSETVTRTQPVRTARPAHWIDHWDPEDPDFWRSTGRPIARRNLIWSIFAEHIGFSVWLLWSIVVVRLGDAGWNLSTSQTCG